MAEYSPMMQHYLETKEKYKDCILFYRLGDFYEMFFEDAKIAARELELTLTGKECGQPERAPMAGVPFHAAESYISKLIVLFFVQHICFNYCSWSNYSNYISFYYSFSFFWIF